VLNQFRVKCQLDDPEENLGGVKVLMDVLWKIFTRRKSFIEYEEHHKILQEDNHKSLKADNYYHVPFVVSIVEVLTDLCIGADNKAVRIVQDTIARELLVINEPTAVRRRPEPECDENPWAKYKITVDDHEKKLSGKKRALADLFAEKDDFILLVLGTLAFFEPHDKELEESEGIKIPRVLWMQSRAQPPRFACGTYKDDVAQHIVFSNTVKNKHSFLENSISVFSAGFIGV
jgi:hypothetical protein